MNRPPKLLNAVFEGRGVSRDKAKRILKWFSTHESDRIMVSALKLFQPVHLFLKVIDGQMKIYLTNK